MIAQTVPRPGRPRPSTANERLGWGVWLLVGACVLLGALFLVALRGWVPPPPTAREPGGPPAAPPAGAGLQRAAEGRAAGLDRPPAPAPSGGEGRVVLSPQSGLRVLWAKPQGHVPVFPHAVIEIQFSGPMDRGSLRQGFEMAPAVDGVVDWPRGDLMIFRPRRHLEMGTEYRAAVNAYARDFRGREYIQPHEWTFQVHKAYAFRENVGRVIRHGCGPCHGPGRPAARVPLGSYAEVMRHVKPGDAAGSPLYAALADQSKHGRVTADWQAMYYVLRDWIDRFRAAD